jgi:hypothetical protein
MRSKARFPLQGKTRSRRDDEYDYRYTNDPALAKQTALRMRHWLEFHDEGNGDRFCFDMSTAGHPVVFDQHDWMDGGSGHNGHLLGESLLAFYTAWSRVCFQRPEGLWWPSVFQKDGGINWTSKEFRKPFRLRGRPPNRAKSWWRFR